MGTIRQLDNRILSTDIITLDSGKLLSRYWIDTTINAIIDRIN